MDLSRHASGTRTPAVCQPSASELGPQVLPKKHSSGDRRAVRRPFLAKTSLNSVAIQRRRARVLISPPQEIRLQSSLTRYRGAAPGRLYKRASLSPGGPRQDHVPPPARAARPPGTRRARNPREAQSSPRHPKPALAARRRAEEEEDVHARRPSGARPRARFGYYQRRRGAGRLTRGRRRAAARRGRAAEPGRASRPARAGRKRTRTD